MSKDIRTREMITVDADPEVEYSYPLKTREEIMAHLATHPAYFDHGYHLSWDIKVGRFDSTGYAGPEGIDPTFDQRWDEYVQSRAGDELFTLACEGALMNYVDGSYTTYPGRDAGVATFGTRGRSGGHLVLTEWVIGEDRKVDMCFRSEALFKEWLGELSDRELARLYVLVENVDHDTKDPGKEIAFQFNFRRAEIEREWVAEASPKPAGM